MQTVVAIGGRHPDAIANAQTIIERRARQRPKYMAAIGGTIQDAWEQTGNGPILPTGAVTVDTRAIREYHEYLVKGLHFHHQGCCLPSGVIFSSSLPSISVELVLIEQTNLAMRADGVVVSDDIGGGVLRYHGIIHKDIPGLSAWQIEFGQMQWVADNGTPGELVRRRFIVTKLGIDFSGRGSTPR